MSLTAKRPSLFYCPSAALPDSFLRNVRAWTQCQMSGREKSAKKGHQRQKWFFRNKQNFETWVFGNKRWNHFRSGDCYDGNYFFKCPTCCFVASESIEQRNRRMWRPWNSGGSSNVASVINRRNTHNSHNSRHTRGEQQNFHCCLALMKIFEHNNDSGFFLSRDAQSPHFFPRVRVPLK